MVVEHGGTFSMNLNNSVTHCIAAESKEGIKFRAAKLHGDVIHCSWLFDCCSLKKRLPLLPKYFLFLSESTKKKLQEKIDEFSDSYFLDVNLANLRELLSNVERTKDSKKVAYYKKKYCPKEKWMRFHDCCIYFYLPMQYTKTLEQKVLLELALRRMKLEVSFGGGKVGDDLSCATHLVVVSLPDALLDFNVLLSSFSEAEKHLLHSKQVHVVISQWLEDCFKSDQRLPEQNYTLKPTGLEESMTGESDRDPGLEDSSKLDVHKQNTLPEKDGNPRKIKTPSVETRLVTLPSRRIRRKRGRLQETTTGKVKPAARKPQRTRARVGSKPVKIVENESDESASPNDQTVEELSEKDAESFVDRDMAHDHSDKNKVDEAVDDSGLLERAKALEGEATGCSKHPYTCTETHSTESAKGNGSKKDEKSVHMDMDNPVQAMLLDMIPSLGTKMPDSSDLVPREDKLLPDPIPKPKKKRKVSYKDVANDLLKDW